MTTPASENTAADEHATDTNAPVVEPRRTILFRQKPSVRWTLILLSIALCGGIWFLPGLGGETIPEPPRVALEGSQPLVSIAIGRARARVVERPQSPETWGRYGMYLYAHEFLSAAMTCFHQAAVLDGDDYRWPYLKGICVTFTNPELGLAFFEESVRLRPDLVHVRMRMVELALDLNRHDLADENLQLALTQAPQDPRVTLAAARLAMMRNDPVRARQYAIQSCEMNADNRGTYELLARICFQEKDQDSAQKYLKLMENATRTDDWPDPLLGKIMEMRRDLTWVIFRAQQQIDAGEVAEALATLQQMITEFPDSVELRMELIRALQTIGNTTEADTVLAAGLKAQPTSARLHRMQGLRHFQREQAPQAIISFQRAIELKPDFSLAHYNLGQCLLQIGDRDGAITEFQMAYSLQPDLPGLKQDLAELLSP